MTKQGVASLDHLGTSMTSKDKLPILGWRYGWRADWGWDKSIAFDQKNVAVGHMKQKLRAGVDAALYSVTVLGDTMEEFTSPSGMHR